MNMVSNFHVLREFNYQAYLLANEASTPSQRVLNKNGEKISIHNPLMF
jgi:hypothetical protein